MPQEIKHVLYMHQILELGLLDCDCKLVCCVLYCIMTKHMFINKPSNVNKISKIKSKYPHFM